MCGLYFEPNEAEKTRNTVSFTKVRPSLSILSGISLRLSTLIFESLLPIVLHFIHIKGFLLTSTDFFYAFTSIHIITCYFIDV